MHQRIANTLSFKIGPDVETPSGAVSMETDINSDVTTIFQNRQIGYMSL